MYLVDTVVSRGHKCIKRTRVYHEARARIERKTKLINNFKCSMLFWAYCFVVAETFYSARNSFVFPSG